MINTILDKCKFLEVCQSDGIQQRLVPTSLKTYADTLLFYYLGYLAIKYSSGNVLEIGIGGSTVPLKELSSKCNKTLYLCDPDRQRMDALLAQQPGITNPYTSSIVDISDNLENYIDEKLSYIHIDGDKNFLVNCKDLNFSVKHLTEYGIICQDDYGNNKWPTVTNAVHSSMNDLEFLVVGDSSAWLVKKEAHKFWVDILKNDLEFNLLREFLNIHSSHKLLGYSPEYFFMNGLLNIFRDMELPSDRANYYVSLFKYASPEYLRMPYGPQSTIGSNVFLNDSAKRKYTLTEIWESIKDPLWGTAPQTLQDINNLSEEIKSILQNKNINIYEYTLVKQ